MNRIFGSPRASTAAGETNDFLQSNDPELVWDQTYEQGISSAVELEEEERNEIIYAGLDRLLEIDSPVSRGLFVNGAAWGSPAHKSTALRLHVDGRCDRFEYSPAATSWIAENIPGYQSASPSELVLESGQRLGLMHRLQDAMTSASDIEAEALNTAQSDDAYRTQLSALERQVRGLR